jgi:Ca2+-binding RTX toxin-like protein
MAVLRTYSRTFEQASSSEAATTRWRFNEDTGTTAIDSVDALDGTYEAGAAPGAAGTIGDGAASFDGSTGFVRIESPPDDPLARASGSFEVVFTADRTDVRQTLFAKNADTDDPGRLSGQLREGGQLVMILSSEDGTTEVASAAGAVEVGEPVHMVFNYGVGGMELFVNGVEVDSNEFTGGISSLEPLVIGAESGGSTPGGTLDDLQRFFEGAIDEFATYDRGLTADEVQRLAESAELGSTILGTEAADRLLGGSDGEDLRGALGDDVIRGRGGDDELRGGGGADTLLGGPGNDDIIGGPGNDALNGHGGADRLFGGRGIDVLLGGSGDDLLNGGGGQDRLIGNSGSDVFRIDRLGRSVDEVEGFEDGPGGDILDLSGVLDVDGGDVEDFVRLSEVEGDTTVEVNRDGAGDDFRAAVKLVGTTGLDLATLVNDGNVEVTPPPAS